MKYEAYNKPTRYYDAPDFELNKATSNIGEKPKSIKENFKRSWRAFRMKQHILDRISIVYLSHRFKCSENMICRLWQINDTTDPLPSRKIIERKNKTRKIIFDDDVPF